MKTKTTLPFAALALAACASGQKPVVTDAPQIIEHDIDWGATAPVAVKSDQSASLWATSAGSLLAMRRAKAVGDLLTVVVEMDDRADVESSLSRSRASDEDLNINALFGLPSAAGALLPGGASLAPAFDYGRNSSVNGAGAVSRSEKIAFTLAARVVGIEPNGNLIISGYQQTRVANEVRYLTVSGVIRSQDITRDNRVSYEKIADAQLAYLSEGEATRQHGRGGVTKIIDRFAPF